MCIRTPVQNLLTAELLNGEGFDSTSKTSAELQRGNGMSYATYARILIGVMPLYKTSKGIVRLVEAQCSYKSSYKSSRSVCVEKTVNGA